MKKHLLAGIVAIAVAMGMASCKQKSEAPAAAGEQAATEQVENAQQPSVEEIVAKAKAEGANWSVDQWKSATKDMMTAMKPMLLKIASMVERMEKEPDKMVEIMSEMDGMKKEYEPYEALMNEFEAAAKATENGKAVMDDEAWGDELKKELGLPDDM